MSNRYRDASLSPEERTEDLLAQMTLDEKLAQLQCHFFAHGDLQKDTRYGIGQVSTLEFRQALSLKEASGIQREIQETVMKNSRFGDSRRVPHGGSVRGTGAGRHQLPGRDWPRRFL